MKMQPLVSIIVPVYNAEKYLKRCVDSILCQSYSEFECLLIDDGSTDNSYNICKEYELKDARIKVMHQENAGQSKARNVALDIAKGDFFAFVDSDDWIQPEMLQTMMGVLINKKADVAMCNATENQSVLYIDNQKFLLDILADNVGGQLWKFIFKRDLWDDIRMPVGRYVQDAMVVHKVLWKAKKIEIIAQQLYNYFEDNPDSTSNRPDRYFKGTVDRAILFVDRYRWCSGRIENKEVRLVILKKASEFIIGALGCYRDWNYHETDIKYLCEFVKNNRKEILRNPYISGGRKIAICIINISPRFYCCIRKIMARLKVK